jgi:serine/threonine-protein kinase
MSSPGNIYGLRYRIVKAIGRGGMATVYRARDRWLGRDVALKLLPAQVIEGALSARFEREAKNGARLDHPGCVKVLDYGASPDGGAFLAMELVEGPTLRAELDRRKRLPIGEAVDVARQLLAALAHAHRREVLHRDVKPENVMFAGEGRERRAVLIDFGLSHLRDDAPLTAAGTCVGSPSYLAPERLLGPSYDERADQYAVAVVLYEMIAGERLFGLADAMEVARRQIQEQPRPLVMLAPQVPLPLAGAVHKALHKDPAQRHASAEAFLEALEAAIAGTRSAPTAIGWPTAAVPAPIEREPSTLVHIAIIKRRSLLRRALAWLRFGRWRWREESGAIVAP